MSNDLIGVWSLMAHQMENVETGERSDPFGPHPRGTLFFHPGGRMIALITPGAWSAPVGEAAQAETSQRLVAYSGRYRVEPPDRFVTSVDIAWIEPWVGTDQVRGFKRDGDRLEIVNGPMRLPRNGDREAVILGILSWVREAGT